MIMFMVHNVRNVEAREKKQLEEDMLLFSTSRGLTSEQGIMD